MVEVVNLIQLISSKRLNYNVICVPILYSVANKIAAGCFQLTCSMS